MQIKKAKLPPNSNAKVVVLLLSLISDTIPIYNKQSKKYIQLTKLKGPFVIHDKITSNYLNCNDPILAYIVETSSCVMVADYAEEYFTECVIPELEQLLIENLLMDLSGLFESSVYGKTRLQDGSFICTLIAVNTHSDDGGKTWLIYSKQKTGFR